MKRIARALLGMLFLSIGLATPASALAPPMTQMAVGNPGCAENFLTFPVWYRGIVDSNCEVVIDSDEGGISTFIWTIALNIVEMLLHIAGYVAVIFLIVGGYRYLTSFGEPDKMGQAKNTIKNAVIGLMISLAAVAIVRVIVNAAAGGI